MKILYCLAGTFNSGGMERIVIAKANWLAQHGYEVTLVTTEQNGRSDFFPLDELVTRVDLDIMYSENVSINPLKKFIVRYSKIRKHRKKLWDVIRRINPNIVISTFGNEVTFIPSFKDTSKKIAEIHFSRWYRLQLNRKGIWKLIDKYLTNQDYKILCKYDKFVCLTHEDFNNWTGLTNVEVIPNFIENVSSEVSSLTTKRIIAVGRLSYQKGYNRMIKAWGKVNEKHPDWTLDIFGCGELEGQINEQIDSLGLRNCISIHTPTNNIKYEYLKSSGLLLSSHYEGLPMVLLEAMSYGLPLISFDCQCGPSDVIEDGINGFLVKDGDIDSFAKMIIKIIESETLRKKLGKESFYKSKQYTKEEIMKKWDTLFLN